MKVASGFEKKKQVGVISWCYNKEIVGLFCVSPLTSQKSVSYTLQMERTSVMFSPVLLLTSSMRA